MKVLIVIVTILVALGGIGALIEHHKDGADDQVMRDEAVRACVSEGAGPAECECVIDAVIEEFGWDRAIEWGDHISSMTPDERRRAFAIGAACNRSTN